MYSDEETQSANRYPKYEQWKEKFLYSVLGKAVDVLKTEGVFLINMKTSLVHCKYNVAEDICKFLETRLTRLHDIELVQARLKYAKNTNYNPEMIYVFTKTHEESKGM